MNKLEINKKPAIKQYKDLLKQISSRYLQGQSQAVRSVNTALLETNWNIGRYIVEYEQKGSAKAKYGENLLERLSRDLTLLHGKGFSRSNLSYMRLFYVRYPICEKLSHKLTWSHYFELLKIEDSLERSFYEKQALLENWSIPELIRQKRSVLYLRLAASKNKKEILKLAEKGQIVEKPADIIREPLVLDFLQIPQPSNITESELEESLITKLQDFLLELGKGFAFVGRQYRITLDNQSYYVDLVFYHRILKCFVLIDLKKEKAGYEDIGQMNMYLGYFQHEENTEGDNPPVGIVLAREKNDLVVKYAMNNISSRLFVSKYQLYLPNIEELRAVISKQLEVK